MRNCDALTAKRRLAHPPLSLFVPLSCVIAVLHGVQWWLCWFEAINFWNNSICIVEWEVNCSNLNILNVIWERSVLVYFNTFSSKNSRFKREISLSTSSCLILYVGRWVVCNTSYLFSLEGSCPPDYSFIAFMQWCVNPGLKIWVDVSASFISPTLSSEAFCSCSNSLYSLGLNYVGVRAPATGCCVTTVHLLPCDPSLCNRLTVSLVNGESE